MQRGEYAVIYQELALALHRSNRRLSNTVTAPVFASYINKLKVCEELRMYVKINIFTHKSLLYNGYRVFLGGKDGWGVMLTTHPLLVPRLRKS
jgi:hypothetical protein